MYLLFGKAFCAPFFGELGAFLGSALGNSLAVRVAERGGFVVQTLFTIIRLLTELLVSA